LGTTTANSFTDTNPPPVDGVWYAVRAVLPAGKTFWTYGPLTPIPSPPTNLTTTSLIKGIRVTWLKVPGLTSYTVLRSSTVAGPFAPVATIPASWFDTTQAYDDLGLGVGEVWFYQVIGSLLDLAGVPSAPVRGVTQGPPPPPPTAVTATLIDDGFLAAVSWTASPGALRYRVSMNGSFLEAVTGTSYAAVWNRLPTDATVAFQIVAENDGGTSASSSSNPVTTAPGALYGALTATGRMSEVALAWTDRQRAYPVVYRMLRGPASGPFGEIAAISGLAFTDQTAGDWKTWCYQIVVDFESGQTAPSSPACAETRGPPDQLNAGTAPLGILQQDGHRVYGQTFAVRQTGQLVGLEISPSNVTNSSAVSVRLFSGHAYLASVASQAFLREPLTTPPAPLEIPANGTFYLDLTPANLYVAAGAGLRFDVPQSFQGWVALQLGTTAGDAYPAGAATVDGTPFTDGTDLVFKTVVRPIAESLVAPLWFPALPASDRIELAWRGIAGAASYRLSRSSDGGATFVHLAQFPDTTWVDGSLPAGATFVYRLAPVNPAGIAGPSATLTATTRGALDAHRTATGFLYGGPATQRFTTNATGLLTGVDLRATGGPGPLQLAITDAAGVVHGPVVLSPNLPPPASTQSLDTVQLYVDVGALGIHVTQNDVLSFTATPLGTQVLAAGDDPGGGFTVGAFAVPDRALWYQTFVH
jgi:hypothetical protein